MPGKTQHLHPHPHGGGHGAFFSPLSPLLSLIPGWLLPTQTQVDLLLLASVAKLLLLPAYHSTDLEVHRNWLAITHALPLRQWYFDAGSPWTLDYPPFFAYLSYALGLPNRWLGCGDARITHLVDGLGLANDSTKTYMRLSVLLTELVLGAALVALARPPGASSTPAIPETATQLPASMRLLNAKKSAARLLGGAAPGFDEATATVLAASVFFHPGLVIIDHIHFQYNGFLFGVLLWAIWAARERRLLLCAILFSSLLNLKHIYIYIAPAFTIFLLRTYVIPPGAESKLHTHPDIFFLAIERLLGLALVTLLPFAVSIGPIIYDTLAHAQAHEPGVGAVLGQLLSRLFPFSRGLNHAYWAPNAWALWTFADRVALKALRRRPSLGQFLPAYFSRNLANASAVESASRGLVGDTTFAVLPNIVPSVCFALTLLAMLPFLAYLWARPSYRRFLATLTGCGFASFLFGWHVHEKAILLVLIPFTPLAVQSYTHFRIWTILSAAGVVSLFPLLFEVRETPIKIGYAVLWALMVGGQLKRKVYRPVPSNAGLVLHFLEDAYLLGLVPLQIYVDVVHPVLFPSSPQGAAAAAAAQSLQAVQAAGSEGVGSMSSAASSVVGAAIAAAATGLASLPSNTTTMTTSTGAAAALASGAADLLANASSVVSSVVDAAKQAVPDAALPSSSPSPSSVPMSPSAPDANSLEFLPLMLTSVYCALGVCWAWVRLGWACWTGEGEEGGAVGGVEGGEDVVGAFEGSHEEDGGGVEGRAAFGGEALEGLPPGVGVGVGAGLGAGTGIHGLPGNGSTLPTRGAATLPHPHQLYQHQHQHHGPSSHHYTSLSLSHALDGGLSSPTTLQGLGPAPTRIRVPPPPPSPYPPSEDARSHRSYGSVRSAKAGKRRQLSQVMGHALPPPHAHAHAHAQGQGQVVSGVPEEGTATGAGTATGMGTGAPVRRRKVTATGASAAATAAAAAAAAAATAAPSASTSHPSRHEP